jgi:hypothetical protein
VNERAACRCTEYSRIFHEMGNRWQWTQLTSKPVGFDVLKSIVILSISWDITLKSSDVSKEQLLFCLPPDFMLVSFSARPSTLKMEAIFSSETRFDCQQMQGAISVKTEIY